MNILKKIILPFILVCALNGANLQPTSTLTLNAGSTDIIKANSKIYIATAGGKVDIFDQKTKKYLSSISIAKIKDFMGDVIESKIYSIDILNESVLIVSQGEKGGRNIFLYKNNELQTLVSDKKRMFIAQAKFVDKSNIVFATLSNQLYLYDIKNKQEKYSLQISQSKFSYFALNENKKEVIIADESGDLKIIDIYAKKIKAQLSGQNLDNVFQVSWKKDLILTAGQDRRSVLYSDNEMQPYIRKSGFLIYGCALSSDSTLAAYSSDEQNNVTIYNTQSKKDLYTLIDNKMTITKILFLSNNEVLVGTDSKIVNYYKF